VSVFEIVALLLTMAAVFSYLNYRWIRLPTTIGLMLISLVFSLGLIVLSQAGFDLESGARRLISQIDFSKTLMQGMLSFLLFAGALQINLESLGRQKWTITTLATAGVVLSTIVTAGLMFFIWGWMGLTIPFLYCLVFGALISPTDPVAVLGLLRQMGASESLKTKIAGESLFNDGVGIVVFLVIYDALSGDAPMSATSVGTLLLREAAGGILLGLILGWITYRLLKSIDNYQVEILLTLALVSGGYALATALHASGALAIVTAGLLIGNHGRHFAMSDRTREHLDTFWELVDEILNASLFVLIGLEILVLKLTAGFILAGAAAIPIVLSARFLSVGALVTLLRWFREFSPNVVKILTWGGLRGGISVALALSLPAGPHRDIVLVVTYSVVIFSILVQGLTVPLLLRK
jgi:CPA1 family monovalent cation:H+ antiporter